MLERGLLVVRSMACLRKFSFLLMLGVFGLFSFIACAEDAPGPKTPLRVAYLDDPSRDTVLYAIREGIVTSDSIDVEFVLLPLPAIIQAAPAKEYDVIEAATVGVAKAAAGGFIFNILSPGLENFGGTLLFTASDSGIASPADLAGKTVLVPSFGGTFTLETRYILHKGYGLDTSLQDGDVTFIEAPPQTFGELLKSGEAAAAVLIHIPGYMMLNNPEFTMLANVTQEFQQISGGSSMNSVLATYPEVVEAKADALRELRVLLGESLAYYKKNQAKVNKAVTESRGLPPGFLEWWWEVNNYPQGEVTQTAKDRIQAIWQAAQDIGDVKAFPSVDDHVAP
jgi:NitT/TauT family transport system substrate-binding protein